jgi:hypothetical protein
MLHDKDFYFKVVGKNSYNYIQSKGPNRDNAIRKLLFCMYSHRQDVREGCFKNRIEDVEQRYKILLACYGHLILESNNEEYEKYDPNQMTCNN